MPDISSITRITSRTIREDCYRKAELTYSEAALIAGVKPQTIRKWVRKGYVETARAKGPYVVSHPSLKEFLVKGL